MVADSRRVPRDRSVISIGELTRRLNNTSERMSNLNPNKMLMLNAASALQQMFQRVDALEKKVQLLSGGSDASPKTLIDGPADPQ